MGFGRERYWLAHGFRIRRGVRVAAAAMAPKVATQMMRLRDGIFCR